MPDCLSHTGGCTTRMQCDMMHLRDFYQLLSDGYRVKACGVILLQQLVSAWTVPCL